MRVRGRCLSRQVYVEAAPPGQNPGDRAAEATEDVLAAEAAREGPSSAPMVRSQQYWVDGKVTAVLGCVKVTALGCGV